MYDARADELGDARKLAASLIGGENVSLERLQLIYARQGTGVFVSRSDGHVTGVLALILLNEAGLRACETDAFDGLHPRLEWVSREGDEPLAIYAWSIAASTRESAQILVAGCWALGEVVPGVPFFVRAATEAGRRLLTDRMRFEAFPGSQTGLLWSGSRSPVQQVAA